LEEALGRRGLRPSGLNRVSPIVGALERRCFGISETAFEALAESVDAVVHGGAWVHHGHRYEILRAANVGGTHEAIRLAACGRRARALHLVSTMEVLGRRRTRESSRTA